MPNINDVQDKNSEAGIIATLIRHPDFIYQSEDLLPKHFFDEMNGYIYYGIKECIMNDIKEIDAININLMLNKHKIDKITQEELTDIIHMGHLIERHTVEEYLALVDSVLDKAFKRDILKELDRMESICYNETVTDAKSMVYNSLENIISTYDGTEQIIPLGEKIDEVWHDVEKSWDGGNFIDFKFPSLNKFCKISRTDCLIFAAQEKRGKSIMLLNCLVDLLRKGYKVLYIDTELDTKLFVMRLISHLTQIPFYVIRDGSLSESQKEQVEEAKQWIKTTNFMHTYMPVVEDEKILSTVKKYKHKYGLDGLILDYLKGNGRYALDAYENSAALGKTTDLLKNVIAGKENMFVLAAVQATSNGGIADSAKIIRNSSAMMMLERKTEKEIIEDGGLRYGNMKLSVIANRNGELHKDGEYISLTLSGNTCTFTESLQPEKELPY